MKPQKQAFRHDPPNSYGDCFRTAIASLLDTDRDEVPHFFDKCSDDWLKDAEAWLLTKGLTLFEFPIGGELEDVLSAVARWNPDRYYLLLGKSPRGVNHQVIALNDKIVCDPAIEGGGLIGPCTKSGYYWITLLLPAQIHRAVEKED